MNGTKKTARLKPDALQGENMKHVKVSANNVIGPGTTSIRHRDLNWRHLFYSLRVAFGAISPPFHHRGVPFLSGFQTEAAGGITDTDLV